MSKSLKQRRVAFVGYGKMGSAIAEGMLKARGEALDFVLAVYDSNSAALEAAKLAGADEVLSSMDELGRFQPTTLFLAIKPQDARGFLDAFSTSCLGNETRLKEVFSIMAGFSIESIRSALQGNVEKVVRLMPNLPLTVGEGIVGYYGEGEKQPEELSGFISELFSRNCRLVFPLSTEEQVDSLTAIAGSGPAFVLEIVRQYAAASASLGIDQKMSETLALQVFSGALRWLEEDRSSISELKERVTSKGGTTAAGREVLEDGEMERLIHLVLRAANERARALSG